MLLYKRAPYYMVIHFLLGFIANWIPFIGILAIVYQVLQLVFNVRTFPFELRVESGNTITHTLLKLFEMGLGYSIGFIIKARIAYQVPHQDSHQE